MAINFKIFLILIIPITIGLIFLAQYYSNITIKESNLELSKNFFNFNIETKNTDLIELPMNSIFKISGVRGEYIIDENLQKYTRLFFELNDDNHSLYNQLMNTDEKTIVIFPIFTAAAYNEPGFYNFYKGECNEECLTIPIKSILRTEIGGNSAQVLKLLNYKFLSDIEIDKNPKILKDFDKVILLHNEYVTQKEFDAITSHPNVIYLYPNALYAKIDVNYEENTITLIRGHNYPEQSISNGFDWEFENTDPYEYDKDCDNWEFYNIDNGKMLNCYPESQIFEDPKLLKTLKEL
ncbi:hypothetical protein BD31_I0217 [Candidatus Nitrosopumilus salaria BD31]|uniref:Uncharacterized protein n=2 Tax=Nitrosopumilus TaxID=338191 RepID=I3D4Y1_9ARCH|nr:hypothetical protein BD31_I0217 [Candidatus Nitrosopumilus salaria BD31]